MTPNAALEQLVRQVSAQVRWRRVEHYALRGLFWASLLAVALLALKGAVGPLALPAAGALLVLGVVLGAAWGALQRTSRADAARLADRAFGLEDRVATALEWAERPDRTALVDPLVADATARVEALQSRHIIRRIVPREARFLPVPVVIAPPRMSASAICRPAPRTCRRLRDRACAHTRAGVAAAVRAAAGLHAGLARGREGTAHGLGPARGALATRGARAPAATGLRGARVPGAQRRVDGEHGGRSLGGVQGHLALVAAPRLQQLPQAG